MKASQTSIHVTLFSQGAHFFLHVNLTAGAAVQLERQTSRTCIFYKAKLYAKDNCDERSRRRNN